jgi:hypothetical protein
MTARSVPTVRLPPIDLLSTGAGLLVAAAILVLPSIIGAPMFPAEDTAVAGIGYSTILLVVAALVAIAGIADLLGRTELRQGIAVVGLAGLLVGAVILVPAIQDALSEVPGEDPLGPVPYGVVIVWASAMVVGTIGFGPTRTAVLIGLATLAIALLLPAPPDGDPFASQFLAGGPQPLVLLGLVLAAAIWRLLDLPFLGGIVLGGAAFVYTLYLGWPTTHEPAGAVPPGTFSVESLTWLVQSAGVWVGLGALFGRPTEGNLLG